MIGTNEFLKLLKTQTNNSPEENLGKKACNPFSQMTGLLVTISGAFDHIAPG
jgi:hypothetical protein